MRSPSLSQAAPFVCRGDPFGVAFVLSSVRLAPNAARAPACRASVGSSMARPRITTLARGTCAAIALVALTTAPLSAQMAAPTARNHASTTALAAALGVDCAHCHTPDQWSDAGKPAFGVAANMFRMVDVINDRLQQPGRVTCITCHGGATQPSRQPRPALDEQLARRACRSAGVTQAHHGGLQRCAWRRLRSLPPARLEGEGQAGVAEGGATCATRDRPDPGNQCRELGGGSRRPSATTPLTSRAAISR